MPLYGYANGLSCVGCNTGTLSKTRAKAGQHHADMEVRFVADTELFLLICFMRSLIRQLHHFATDFNRMLLQQVGIL